MRGAAGAGGGVPAAASSRCRGRRRRRRGRRRRAHHQLRRRRFARRHHQRRRRRGHPKLFGRRAERRDEGETAAEAPSEDVRSGDGAAAAAAEPVVERRPRVVIRSSDIRGGLAPAGARAAPPWPGRCRSIQVRTPNRRPARGGAPPRLASATSATAALRRRPVDQLVRLPPVQVPSVVDEVERERRQQHHQHRVGEQLHAAPRSRLDEELR